MTVANGRKRRSLLDWKAVVGIAISIAALWFALRDVSAAAVFAEIRKADPLLYLLSVFFATAVFWLRAWRWRTLLATAAPNSTFRSRLAATTIGFMGNNVLPARVGEFARAYAFSKMENITVVASFGSLVVERLFDAIAIIALLFITMAMPGVPHITGIANFSGVARTLAILIIAGLGLGIALVLFPERTVVFFEETVARILPQSIRRPVTDALEAFLSGLSVLRSPKLLTSAIFQTAVLWLFNAVGFWVGFKTFGIDLPFSAALLLQSVIALFVSIPSAPGFFGLFEGAARIVLFDAYHIPLNKTASFAIGFHIGGFIPVTLIGLYYAWRLGLSLGDVERSEETVEEAVEQTLPRTDKKP